MSYSNTSNMMRLKKVYFTPLPLSLGHLEMETFWARSGICVEACFDFVVFQTSPLISGVTVLSA